MFRWRFYRIQESSADFTRFRVIMVQEDLMETQTHFDKHQDFVKYPTDRTSAFFDSPTNVQKFIKEITATGVKRELIDVQVGKKAIETLDIEGHHHGIYGRALRFWQKFLRTGEWLHLEDAAKEIREGHWMVNVVTRSEREKDEVVRLMRANGGHGIKYFNSMYVEHLSITTANESP